MAVSFMTSVGRPTYRSNNAPGLSSVVANRGESLGVNNGGTWKRGNDRAIVPIAGVAS